MIALDLMAAEVPDAELADLDRALTAEEQKRLDAYQTHQADATLKAERAKPGPAAPKVEMEVTTRGATLSAKPPAKPTAWLTWAAVAAALAIAALVAASALRAVRR